MLLLDIVGMFDSAVERQLKGQPQADQLIPFIKNHERKPIALRGVCQEILLYEKRFRTRLNVKQRDEIINACVTAFIHLAKKHRDEQNMSEAAKHQLSAASRRIETAQGLISEAGSKVIEVPDAASEKRVQ